MCTTYKSLCYGYISLETATLSIGIFGTLSSLAYFFCAITLGYFDGEITELTYTDRGNQNE